MPKRNKRRAKRPAKKAPKRNKAATPIIKRLDAISAPYNARLPMFAAARGFARIIRVNILNKPLRQSILDNGSLVAELFGLAHVLIRGTTRARKAAKARGPRRPALHPGRARNQDAPDGRV